MPPSHETVRGRVASIVAMFAGSRTQQALYLIALTTLAIGLRFRRLALNPSFWGEDIEILRGSNTYGPAYIVEPIAGYVFLIPKAISYLSTAFHLRHSDIIFHAASVASIYACILIIWFSVPLTGIWSRTAACLSILAVPVHPSTIYLNLIDTMWLWGAVLPLLVMSSIVSPSRTQPLWLVFVSSVCLTGPLSILAVPALIGRALIYRDLRSNPQLYIAYIVPTLVQFVVILLFSNQRLTGSFVWEWHPWYKGVVENALFALMPSPWLLAPFFGTFLVGFYHGRERRRVVYALSLLCVAAISIAAGFFSYRSIPDKVGPFAAGDRYFFIPFFLILISFLVVIERIGQWIGIVFVALSCAGGIFVLPLGPDIGRGPTYWSSYVDLARFRQDLRVVTRPIWPDEKHRWDFHNDSPEKPAFDEPVAFVVSSGSFVLPVPTECRQLRTLALVYHVTEGRSGFHQFDAQSRRGHLWFSQWRWVKPNSEVIFAVPMSDVDETLTVKQDGYPDLSGSRIICL